MVEKKRASANAFYFGTAFGAACAVGIACVSGHRLEGAVALIVADWLLRKAWA